MWASGRPILLRCVEAVPGLEAELRHRHGKIYERPACLEIGYGHEVGSGHSGQYCDMWCFRVDGP